MVHKIYVKRGGKKHGPYYYESYREDGKIKKRYLGANLPIIPSQEKASPGLKNPFILQVSLIVLVSLFIFGFAYHNITGKSIVQQTGSVVNNFISGMLESAISPEENQADSSTTPVPSEQTPPDNGSPAETAPVPEPSGSNQSDNPETVILPISNETTNETANNAIISNETIRNQTSINQSANQSQESQNQIENETVILPILNETTNQTVANITVVNETVSSPKIKSIRTVHAKIRIGERVKWIKNVSLETAGNVTIELPKEAEDVIVKKIEGTEEKRAIAEVTGNSVSELRGFNIISWLRSLFAFITGRATADTNPDNTVDVILQDTAKEYTIEYYTDAPQAYEKDTASGKEVVISGPDNLNYTDVLSFTSIPETLNVGRENTIKVYWKEGASFVPFDVHDNDGNGKLDYIEWITPHLSNQTFEIILITTAEHLDENRTFVEDVYDAVKARDSVYVSIPENDYVRVTFEKNLTSGNDITLYARSNASGGIKVFEKDSTTEIADFGIIDEDKEYKILLNNLTGSQDIFDLLVYGNSVGFDYIVDPIVGGGTIEFVAPTPANGTTITSTSVEINITVTNISGLDTFIWNWNQTNYTIYNDSLVLMMNMDNRSAIGENETYAVDVSKHSNNVTLIDGATWTDGKYGEALSFDGTDDYASVQFSDNWNFGGNDFTVSWWENRSSISSNGLATIVREVPADYPAYILGYDEDAPGPPALKVYMTSTGSSWDIASGEDMGYTIFDNWSHYVITRDGDSFYTYQNAILIDNWNSSSSLISSSNPLILGRYASINYYRGGLDEVRIYNRSLTADEIRQQYYSNLNKYNSTQWYFYANQSNLSEGSYTYYGYAGDRAGNQNSTETRTVTININSIITNSTVTGSTVTSSIVNNSMIINSNITNSNVTSSTINNSKVFNSVLNICNMVDSNITGSFCYLGNIDPSDIINSNVTGSNVTDSIIQDSNVTYSNVTNVIINRSNVYNSNLTSVNATGCNIANVSLSNYVCVNSSIFSVSACGTLGAANTVYVLNQSFTAASDPCFYIAADNVTFDGGNYLVTAMTNGRTVYSGAKNTIIRNLNVTGGARGIDLNAGSSNASVYNNFINNSNLQGIFITGGSQNNTIRNNVIQKGNDIGIQVDTASGGNIIRNNTMLSNAGYGLVAYANDNYIDGNNISNGLANGIWQINSNNNTYINNYISENARSIDGIGIDIDGTSSSINVINNTFYRNGRGIIVEAGANHIVVGNIVKGHINNGIYLYATNHVNVTNNDVAQNDVDGIRLISSSYNFLTNNLANNNTNGIILVTNSDNNTLASNTANNNSNRGFYIEFSLNNTLMDNTANSNTNDGIRVAFSNYTSVSGSNAHSNTQGIIISGGSIGTNVINNNFDSNIRGIYFATSAANSLVINNTFNNNSDTGIRFDTSYNNTLINNTANYNSVDGVLFNLLAANNTLINNNIHGNTVLDIDDQTTGTTPNYIIYNNGFGEIRWTNSSFLENLTVKGDLTFPGNVTIGNNSASFNSNGFTGRINSSANVTLFGLPTTFTNPKVLKDGANCLDCHNFTSLNAGTVVFNVTSWSNYSVGDVNRLPVVTLVSPADGNSTTNRTPTLVWNATDADGDTLTYELNITVFPTGSDDNRYVQGLNATNYTVTPMLKYLYDNGYAYNWSVRAYDGKGFGNWSQSRTFNVSAVVDISMINGTINFGELSLLYSNDTTDDSPSPFVLQNDGNSFVNVSVSATPLWNSVSSPNNFYKFKVNNASGHEGAFDWQNSITAFTAFDTLDVNAISYLNFSANKKRARVDVFVQVPSGEIAGTKNSNVSFISSLAE